MSRRRHRTSYSAVVLLALASIQSLAAQSSPGSGIISAIPGDDRWSLYRNDHLEFQVEYPKTWTVHSTEPHANLVLFTPPSTAHGISEFSFGLVQPIRDASFRDFASWTRNYKGQLTASGAVIRTERRLEVSGHQALRLTYLDGLPGQTKSTVIDVLIGVPGTLEGRVFRFSYDPPRVSRDAAQHDAIYRRILSSLKIAPRR